jgi:signal transduction histidine kinase
VTLTTRLTLFFLAAQAAVLAGFSVSLYLLAEAHLYRQADERLDAALDTLAAAAEVGPDGVEWETSGRSVHVGPRALSESLAWTVTDGTGRVVARSDRPDATELLAEAADRLKAAPSGIRRLHWQGEHWQAGQRWVEAPGPIRTPAEPGERKFQALVLTAAVPLEPVRDTLRTLAATLFGVSAGILLASVLAGRAICRRALRPVTRMATAARGLDTADPAGRLPAPATGDELADLGRAFNDLLGRFHDALDRERRFTAEAAHQLRTPLAALLGQVEVALRRDRPADDYRRALESARSQADRLRRVAEALLFLARADGEAVPPDRERIDLASWLPDHLETWADHPRAGDLKWEPPAGPALVDVRPALLGELVDNLIDNAFKYSQPDSSVTVRAGIKGNSIWVEVEDRGCGIAEDDRRHLFRPFHRSAEARRLGVPGVGLGLAVAARLAAALGGEVSVESEPGKGSQFRLRLPAGEPTEVSGSEKACRCDPDSGP